jgi:AcrR family transcriptional regulator
LSDIAAVVADPTAQRILLAATDLFIEQGFAAASISKIAKAAAVTPSLIFHHFTNKANLWMLSKQYFVASKDIVVQEELDKAARSLDDFIEFLVDKRFRFYKENPQYVRFMAWQCLDESGQVTLGAQMNVGQGVGCMEPILQVIRDLQQKQCVNQALPAECILAFITNLTNGYFIKNMAVWMTADHEQKYLMIVKQQVEELLQP